MGLRSLSKTEKIASIVATAIAVLTFFGLTYVDTPKPAAAQTNQQDSAIVGAGRDIHGGVVNINTLSLVLQERLAAEIEPDRQDAAQQIISVVLELLKSGTFEAKTNNTNDIAQSVVEAIERTPLHRDLILTRQFLLPPSRAQYLLGGPSRISFEAALTRTRSRFLLDGESYALDPGESMSFQHNGQECEIVYDGRNGSGADMTLICN